jgi:hypothetical protein
MLPLQLTLPLQLILLLKLETRNFLYCCALAPDISVNCCA